MNRLEAVGAAKAARRTPLFRVQFDTMRGQKKETATLMTTKYLFIAPILCVLPITGTAAELTINPGLWETTMTRTNSMTNQSITETKTECVQETKFDPGKMLQDSEGCALIEDDLNGDTLIFRMECNMQGAQAFVDGTFHTDGQTGSGNMDMKVNAGGMNMTMNMNWTANRLGDC